MSDLFYIESVCCMDGLCDIYTGEVSLSDVMSGRFSLNSCNGKEAVVNLDVIAFNADITVNNQSSEAVKREFEGLEFVAGGDGSWYINKNFGNDKFEITIRQFTSQV